MLPAATPAEVNPKAGNTTGAKRAQATTTPTIPATINPPLMIQVYNKCINKTTERQYNLYTNYNLHLHFYWT